MTSRIEGLVCPCNSPGDTGGNNYCGFHGTWDDDSVFRVEEPPFIGGHWPTNTTVMVHSTDTTEACFCSATNSFDGAPVPCPSHPRETVVDLTLTQRIAERFVRWLEKKVDLI